MLDINNKSNYCFFKVKNLGDLKPIPQLFGDQGVISTEHFYRNLTLRLHESGTDKWWEVLEDCSDSFYNRVLGHLPYANCVSSTVMYTFSDKLFPATLSWLTAGGFVVFFFLNKHKHIFLILAIDQF